jgi:hypothetical protein
VAADYADPQRTIFLILRLANSNGGHPPRGTTAAQVSHRLKGPRHRDMCGHTRLVTRYMSNNMHHLDILYGCSVLTLRVARDHSIANLLCMRDGERGFAFAMGCGKQYVYLIRSIEREHFEVQFFTRRVVAQTARERRLGSLPQADFALRLGRRREGTLAMGLSLDEWTGTGIVPWLTAESSAIDSITVIIV